jgi:serine/threonine-protein kinase
MIETLGQYKVLEPAGPGALGDVYRARDTRAGRTVALTIVSDRIALDPSRRERFLDAARAAAGVSHPNIVTLYDVGEDDGHLYLVHEFIQGQTLKSVIGGRPLPPRRAIDLPSQIAEGMADAHAADLVHGHITAETVVVTPKGNAKIIDFGLAGWSAAGGEAGGAEEAGRAGGDIGYRADLFSLGVILFEMLTGHAPVPGAAVPSAVNRSLPREVDPIVAKALGKSGGYESAVTLAAELRAVGAILDVRQEVHDVAAASVVVSRRKRSSARWMILVLIAAALAALALAIRWGYLFKSA